MTQMWYLILSEIMFFWELPSERPKITRDAYCLSFFSVMIPIYKVHVLTSEHDFFSEIWNFNKTAN